MSKVNTIQIKAESALSAIETMDKSGFKLNSIIAVSEYLERDIAAASQVD